MLKISSVLIVFLTCGAAERSAEASVVSSGQNGFAVRITVDIAAPSGKIYQALVDRISDWWDSEHTFSEDAKNLTIDARPGGCFCERFPNGGGVHHMTVVFVQPGRLLRMSGGLGPFQELGVSGAMTWKLSEAGGHSTLELTYNVAGYQPDGFQKLASLGDLVLTQQVGRLKKYVEGGTADPK